MKSKNVFKLSFTIKNILKYFLNIFLIIQFLINTIKNIKCIYLHVRYCRLLRTYFLQCIVRVTGSFVQGRGLVVCEQCDWQVSKVGPVLDAPGSLHVFFPSFEQMFLEVSGKHTTETHFQSEEVLFRSFFSTADGTRDTFADTPTSPLLNYHLQCGAAETFI